MRNSENSPEADDRRREIARTHICKNTCVAITNQNDEKRRAQSGKLFEMMRAIWTTTRKKINDKNILEKDMTM